MVHFFSCHYNVIHLVLTLFFGSHSITGRLSVARKKLTATTLGDNLVMFAGGFKSNMAGLGYRAEVDIYNASSKTWSTARLAQGRMRLAAASSGDCAVFAGGEVNTTNNDGRYEWLAVQLHQLIHTVVSMSTRSDIIHLT